MTMMLFTGFLEFPKCLFSSHTLKHLTLEISSCCTSSIRGCVPKSAWDFPVLETLNLSCLQLGGHRDKSLDLFSKCVNLKDLTLYKCSMSYLETFTVCAPLLSNLTIKYPVYFPKVLNMVAPQLKNLTTSVDSSTCVKGLDYLQLSTAGLDSLEKVNLSLSSVLFNDEKRKFFPQLLDLFQKLRSAKFLILDRGIIAVLSSCQDQLLHEHCPFDKLKCLKQKKCFTAMPTGLKNYFLESSPTATFILDLPQKRSRQQQVVDKGGIMAKEVEEETKRQKIS
ncbi:hypothetical protein L6452_21952 [Arctium lappa]|uniref:Uncharacterized protein n=1 Tax=Arctium lappa TaxID=4217 RepID=A0ACB9AXL4_ARCLA|nr:hypothetical protein L6452_21952 [Arctium lappa]